MKYIKTFNELLFEKKNEIQIPTSTKSTLCRKLAWKSTLKFGKYSDLTIQEILDAQHTRYLRWIYYNVSGINFMDDILDTIHIKEEDKIEKPGKDPEKGMEVDDKVYSKANFKSKSHMKKLVRMNTLKSYSLNRNISSPEILTRKNQDHQLNQHQATRLLALA